MAAVANKFLNVPSIKSSILLLCDIQGKFVEFLFFVYCNCIKNEISKFFEKK